MMSTPKISLIMSKMVLCGEFIWPWYQEAMSKAFEKLDIQVHRFSWLDDLYNWPDDNVEPVFKSVFHKFQFKFQIGPSIDKINKKLISFTLEQKPDILLLYHAILISPKTIREIKSRLPNTKIVQYTPDNPFGKNANKTYWNNFLKNIECCDYTTPHREKNKLDIQNHGGVINNNFILYPYFIPEEEYPMDISKIPSNFHGEVVFAGHYENDHRIEYLEALLNEGINLKLFGGGWDKALKELPKNSKLLKLLPTQPAVGEDYLYALNGSELCLCFFSSLNEDTYTTRVFQIPATKSVLVSEYSDEIAKIYVEDKEAIFFRDKEEFIKKIRELLSNKNMQREIAFNGFNKVYKDGHDIYTRAKKWLEAMNDY